MTPSPLRTALLLLIAGMLAVFLLGERQQAALAADDARAAQQIETAARVALTYRRTRLAAADSAAAFRRRLAAHRAPPAAAPLDIAAGFLPVIGPEVTIVGGDTLVTLAFARTRLQVLADSANARLGVLQQHIGEDHALLAQAERTVAQMQAALMAADTALAEKDRAIRAVQRTRPSWVQRAVAGVVAAGAGAACGSALYIVAGPVGAVGGLVGCAAVTAAVRR